MGLASGGGGRGGGFGGGGFAWGYLAGSSRYRSSDVSPGVAIFAGVTLLGMMGLLIGGAIVGTNQTKEEKAKLNTTIATHFNYKSVDINYFDWYINNDEEYIFKFTGSAINIDNVHLDFISCGYEVSEQQYYEVLHYIEKNDIEDLDTKGLLSKLNEIIQEAELLQGKEDTNVATSSDERIILNVSRARVSGDKVSYYVCYTKQAKDKNGCLGLVTTIDEVSYDLTDELKENPNGVFTLPREKAKVKVLQTNFTKAGYCVLNKFDNPSKDRVQVVKKGAIIADARQTRV